MQQRTTQQIIEVPFDYHNILTSLDATNVKPLSIVKEVINNFMAAIDIQIKKTPERKNYNFKMTVEFDQNKKASFLSYKDDVSGIEPSKIGQCLALRYRKHSTESYKNEHNNGLNLVIVKTSSGIQNPWKLINVHKGNKMIIEDLRLGERQVPVTKCEEKSGLELQFENPKFDLFSPNMNHNSRYFKFLNTLGAEYGRFINKHEENGIDINIDIEYSIQGTGPVSKRIKPIRCPIINPDNQQETPVVSFPLEYLGKKGTVSLCYKKELNDPAYKEGIYGSVHPYKVSNGSFGADIYIDDIKICEGFMGMELLGLSARTKGGNQGIHNRLHIEIHLEPNHFRTTTTKDGILLDSDTRSWFEQVKKILVGEAMNPKRNKKLNYLAMHFRRAPTIKEKAKQDKIYSLLDHTKEFTEFRNISRERHVASGGRLDICWHNKQGTFNIFEIKNGTAKRDHINQCMGYAIELLDEEQENDISITLLCDHIDEKMVMLKNKYLKYIDNPRLTFKIEKISENKICAALFQN
tara:strand:+ start:205 stop:1770 length:1566 start_codon:yes stop_codon:yes gene_type:complete